MSLEELLQQRHGEGQEAGDASNQKHVPQPARVQRREDRGEARDPPLEDKDATVHAHFHIFFQLLLLIFSFLVHPNASSA